jgi:TldD protein
MRAQIEAALKSSQAAYSEIRLEERHSTTVEYRGKNLESASPVIDSGGIVRCLCQPGGWGLATFNDLSDLVSKVQQAYECARLVPAEKPIELAPVPVVTDHLAVSLERDFRGISLAEKVNLAESYNQIMLKHSDKIVDTRTFYQDRFSRHILANSEGTYIEEERPLISLYTIATARQDDDVQMAYETCSDQVGFEFVLDREELALTAAQRAIDLLSAQSVVGGRYPVVIDPMLAGVFIHEAFGHLSEADFVYENPKMQEMMVLGRRFGQDFLNVFDDGGLAGLRGTHKYDDEGTPTGRSDLIKDGLLVGRLHSRETAALMGESPTGNARATSYRFPPIVRMTNTAIGNGDTPFKDLIKDIKRGVYALDNIGGQTFLENFSFSAAYAYMIRDGEIAELVKDVILAGNLFTTLQNIDAIGDDFDWSHQGGYCGKGQSGLPVTFGAPHVRIQDVVIGGK